MFAIWAYDTFHDGAGVIVVALYGGIFFVCAHVSTYGNASKFIMYGIWLKVAHMQNDIRNRKHGSGFVRFYITITNLRHLNNVRFIIIYSATLRSAR